METLNRPMALLTIVAAASLAGAAEPSAQHHAPPAAGVESLSAPLREALSREMIALQNGMMQLVPALVAGHWDTVADIGKRMQASYIMKQALSEAQLDELHRSLPEAFQELDGNFHYLAGMLSHAAGSRKPELMSFYLGRMTETCVACHARYATAKFPALAAPEAEQSHDH